MYRRISKKYTVQEISIELFIGIIGRVVKNDYQEYFHGAGILVYLVYNMFSISLDTLSLRLC